VPGIGSFDDPSHPGSKRGRLASLGDRADHATAFQTLTDDVGVVSAVFERVGRFFSVRVVLSYRVLGVEVEDGVLWFWIGSHADYDRILG
jgi:hypothetical protein